mgnify:CR=1 FL=1
MIEDSREVQPQPDAPANRAEFRSLAHEIGQTLLRSGGLNGRESVELCPLTHSFADGCYIREIHAPAGIIATTKTHKHAHPFFLMKGELSILTENGAERVSAPYHGITPVGTQRVIYTHSDTHYITVHATELTDVEEIEKHLTEEGLTEMTAESLDWVSPEEDQIWE